MNAWDPAKDEAEGNQCKGYGAGAISRLPTRAHVTWQDGNTLKWETDQGMQTRMFKFGPAAQESGTNPGARSWQGLSIATWEPAAGGRGGPGGGLGGGPGGPPIGLAAPPAAAVDDNAPLPGGPRGGNLNGWLKVVTTNMKSGYLRKNGVPYSEKATITEYFQPTPETYGVRYMIVTTIKVKNLSNGPIAGLKVDEFWYDKGGEPVTGAQPFRYRKALMPGEVIDVRDLDGLSKIITAIARGW